MWEQKSDDGTIHDKDNLYTWGLIEPPYAMNGTAVTTLFGALNAGTTSKGWGQYVRAVRGGS